MSEAVAEASLEERARRHIMRELGLSVARTADRHLVGRAAIVPQACVPGTAVVRMSALAAWADTLAGLISLDEVGPRVPVTLQLDVNLFVPPDGVTEVVAVGRLVKAGSTVVVADVDFEDQDGRPLGVSTGLFMVAPDPEIRMPEGQDPIGLLADPGGPLQVPLAERAGCERLEPGVATLARREDGLNASGSVNGGLLALVVEEAALSAAPGTSLSMMALRYVRPVRLGPAVARATVHGDVAEVIVSDEGRAAEGRGDDVAVAATTRAF